MSRLKKCLLGTALGISVLITVFILWAVLPFTVMDEAQAALSSNDSVLVENDRDICFIPVGGADKGLILYPGARVNSEAYAVLARRIAEKGYLIVLAQMPLDLSFFDIDRAERIISEHGEISTWAIGGHSMGGAMAAFFIDNHPGLMKGLIFLGSYPSDDTDLSGFDLSQLSLYGSKELVSSEKEVLSRKHLAPVKARFSKIEGGNHAGFGFYGDQKGDGAAEISRDEQQRIAAEEISAFMGSL